MSIATNPKKFRLKTESEMHTLPAAPRPEAFMAKKKPYSMTWHPEAYSGFTRCSARHGDVFEKQVKVWLSRFRTDPPSDSLSAADLPGEPMDPEGVVEKLREALVKFGFLTPPRETRIAIRTFSTHPLNRSLVTVCVLLHFFNGKKKVTIRQFDCGTVK